MSDEILECEYCQAEIGPEDELVEHDGMDFCSDTCLEAWQEQYEVND